MRPGNEPDGQQSRIGKDSEPFRARGVALVRRAKAPLADDTHLNRHRRRFLAAPRSGFAPVGNSPMRCIRLETRARRGLRPLKWPPIGAAETGAARPVEHRAWQAREPRKQERVHLGRHILTIGSCDVRQLDLHYPGTSNQNAADLARGDHGPGNHRLRRRRVGHTVVPAGPRQIFTAENSGSMASPPANQVAGDRVVAAADDHDHPRYLFLFPFLAGAPLGLVRAACFPRARCAADSAFSPTCGRSSPRMKLRSSITSCCS